jgi:hypothetical protein
MLKHNALQNLLFALILMTFAYLPTVHAQTFVDAEYVQAETNRMKHLSDSLRSEGKIEQSDAIQYDSLPNFLIGQFVNDVRGRRRISCPFQASHLAARRGARRAHSPATQPTKQRSMAARGQHQMGKLFFADP